MNGRRVMVAGAAIVAVVPAAVTGALTALATQPKLAAKAFGSDPNPSRHPSEFGLNATDVDYAPGGDAWWIPAPAAFGSVVIVHGFETSAEPKATDPGPRLELAQVLHEADLSCLVISLGYGSGVHPHSGGELEAEDVAAAVEWASAEGGLPVAVVGFSAGGHAAVAATSRVRIAGVVTDSSFVDFAEVVIDQGREVLPVPAWMLGAVPRTMKMATGRSPVNLESWPIDTSIPMLHIHGEADEAIDFGNLARMAACTGGETLAVSGADHIQSLLVERDRYVEAVVRFLRDSFSASAEGE